MPLPAICHSDFRPLSPAVLFQIVHCFCYDQHVWCREEKAYKKGPGYHYSALRAAAFHRLLGTESEVLYLNLVIQWSGVLEPWDVVDLAVTSLDRRFLLHKQTESPLAEDFATTPSTDTLSDSSDSD